MKAFKERQNTNLNPHCVTCTQPGEDGGTIGFTENWKVILHPDQSGLGSCLVAPRRHVARMADLTGVEWKEFSEIISELEPALEVTFNAQLVNLYYQRNWAFRTENPDPPFKDGKPNPHVHWHVVPRYESDRMFGGEIFVDPTFGEPFEWRRNSAASIRQDIIESIKSNLRLDYA